MNSASRLIYALSTILVLDGFCLTASAYELKPAGTDNEEAIVNLEEGLSGKFWSGLAKRIVNHFSHNVHEEVTNRIWGCTPAKPADPKDKTCQSWTQTPAAVIYGVQWNDNPPFKLDSTASTDRCKTNSPIRLPDRQPACWYILFGDAAQRAANGEFLTQESNFALVYRTHFGDLQFLHSMASWNGERTREVKNNILMWAEFSYKVSIGEILPSTPINQVSVPGFEDVLGNYWGDVSSLFTYGVSRYAHDVADVAFGSFLHMIQDSFSRSHSERQFASILCGDGKLGPNAGELLAFYAYGGQDSDNHAKQDSRDLMLADILQQPDGNVVTVGRQLKIYRDARAPWETVRSYLDQCVYSISKENLKKPSGPGPFK